MRRPILFAVLSFLLLFMQLEAQVHALSHLGPQLARSHLTELIAPHVDEACVECALLTAGTSGVLGDAPALAPMATATQRALLAFQSRAVDFPAYFSSRAPPFVA